MSERRKRRAKRRHPYEGAWPERAQRPAPYPAGYEAGGYDPGSTGGYYAPYADDWEWEDEPRVGMISPARVMLALLALAAGGIAFYGFLDRSVLQLPIIIAGLALFGAALLGLALSLARVSVQLARGGSGGRGLLAAFFGGLCILGAGGALAGAIVLAMLTF